MPDSSRKSSTRIERPDRALKLPARAAAQLPYLAAEDVSRNQPVVAMLNHAIENFEMLSSIGQQLGIRGMICALDRNYHSADLGVLFT